MLNKRIGNKETENKKSVSTYANVERYINIKRRKTCQCHTDKISKNQKKKKSKNSCRKEKRRKRIMQCDFHREIRWDINIFTGDRVSKAGKNRAPTLHGRYIVNLYANFK